MVTISCKCGNVKIGLTGQPVFCGECGCVDCLGKLLSLQSQGGPKVPSEIASKDECLVAQYWYDRLDVQSGKEQLIFTTIRENAMSTNCVASCCSTCMVVDNPFYHQGEGKIGSTDGSGLIMLFDTLTPTGVETSAEIRWWIKDIPDEKYKKMKPLPGMYCATSGDFNTLTFVNEGAAAMGKFNQFAATFAPSEARGVSFATLLAECGGKVDLQPISTHE